MLFGVVLIVAIVLLSVAAYKKFYGYWTQRDVEGPTPLPFFGNLLDLVMGRKHYGIIYGEIYKYGEYGSNQ